MIGMILIKEYFKLSVKFKWWGDRKCCLWILMVTCQSNSECGTFFDFCSLLVQLLGCSLQSFFGLCVFLSAAGFLHRVKNINCLPQNPSHSYLPCLNGAPLQVIRFLSSIHHCGFSVYAKKTNVSAAGNINTYWICYGEHFPGNKTLTK